MHPNYFFLLNFKKRFSVLREKVAAGLFFTALFLFGSGSLGVLAQPGDTRVHDPVMIKQDSTYYLFSTGWGISVRSSKDMQNWEREEPVLDEAPEWTKSVVPDFNNVEWAPDIAYHDGTYYLYYSVSQFGRNTSAIGVATNQTLHPDAPNYEWKDRGKVIQSVPGRDMWNAIDPNLAFDEEGTPWLAFGSYWLGLKLVKLEDNLTEVADTPQKWHTIAARHRYWKLDERSGGDSMNGDIEAPFIFKKNGYYYLFASWDRCCAGNRSTYKIVVGRSKKITGPYLDRSGKDMKHGGGTLVAKGNQEWAAVGHNSAYTFNGTDYIVSHAYEDTEQGHSRLWIEQIRWSDDGWPEVSLD